MRDYKQATVGQEAPVWMGTTTSEEEYEQECWRGAALPCAQEVMKQDMLRKTDDPQLSVHTTFEDLFETGNDSFDKQFKTGPSLASIQDMKKPDDSGQDSINPSHYNDIPKEQQHHRVVVAHGLDWYCACALKYLMRAGKKSSVGMTKREKEIDDLKKARQYIDMKLKEMEEGRL